MNELREYETWARDTFAQIVQGTTLAQRTAGGMRELRDGRANVALGFMPAFVQQRMMLVLSAQPFAFDSVCTLWQRDVLGPLPARDLVLSVREMLSARIGSVAKQYNVGPHVSDHTLSDHTCGYAWYVPLPVTLPPWVAQVEAGCMFAYRAWRSTHILPSRCASMLAQQELFHMPCREVAERLQSAPWLAECEQAVARMQVCDAALEWCLRRRAGLGVSDASHWLF